MSVWPYWPSQEGSPYAEIVQYYFEIARAHLNCTGSTFVELYGSDRLSLVKVSHMSNRMDESANFGKKCNFK